MSGSITRRLADATIVALRATLPQGEGVDPGSYMLLPSPVPITHEELAVALESMGKPVRCVGLTLAGHLAIAAWPMPAPDDGGAERSSPYEESVVLEHPAARLLLVAPGEEPVVLRPDEMLRWRENYKLLGVDLVWNWIDDDPRAHRYGATSMVELSRSGT